jgi:RNA polymerase sigma factor (sigma-70 family)
MRGALEAIGRIYGGSGLENRDDFDLLARFAASGDERAFRTLVERHGKLVMAVCRQVTRDAHDAEDAFQATFLVLARKAPGLWRRGTLAGWLHRVARRVAVEAARKRDLARKLDEAGAVADRARPDRGDLDWLPALHEEIDRLPEKYRSVVVLCDLEELTRDEAARRLGWPPGTVAGRLSRARAQLRARLERRGLVPGGAMLPAAAAVPEALVEAAVSAVVHPGSAAVAATLLAEGALMAMRFSLIRAVVVASVSCAALVAGGLAAAGGRPSPQDPPAAPPAPAAPVVVQQSSARPFGVVSKVERPPLAVAPEGERTEFEVLVLDSTTKQPVPGATVRMVQYPSNQWFTTGPDGVARGLRTQTVDYDLLVDAWSERHQNTRRGWSNRPGSRWEPLEPRVTIEVDPGELTVGGRVIDEQGRPIPGVTVELRGRREGESSLDFYDFTARTDRDGRWASRAMPADLSDLTTAFLHPDYVSPLRYAGDTAGQERRLKELKTQSRVDVLKKGRRLEGRVADEQGRAVEGAILRRVNSQGGNGGETKSGSDGRFTFPAAPDPTNSDPLLTIAPGQAPDLRWLSLQEMERPLEIRLGPGREVRGRVVDLSGRPVPEAWVAFRRSGEISLYEVFGLTDLDGSFTWAGAPKDAIEIVASKPGFEAGPMTYPPGVAEQQWTLGPRTRAVLHLRVADARTGRPVDRFEMRKGRLGEEGTVEWVRDSERQEVAVGGNGRGNLVLGASPGGWKLRVTAQGYRPRETDRLDLAGEEPLLEPELELELEPLAFGEGDGPSGLVVDEAGRPVGGAEVMLATESQRARLLGGSWRTSPGQRSSSGAGTIVADDHGRFTFSPTAERYELAAAHPTGYGAATADEFAKTGRLVLRPWGRAEGRVVVGGVPRVGATVHLDHEESRIRSEQLLIAAAEIVATDTEGRFEAERLPAGDFRARAIEEGIRLGDSYLTIAPGETTTTTIGGGGRPVVGLIVVEGADGDETLGGGIHSDRPMVPYPAGLSREEYLDWARSGEERAYLRAYHDLGAKIAADGSFRIEDVPSDDYVLGFWAKPGGVGPQVRFRMPPIEGGQSAEPLDLGVIRLESAERVDPRRPLTTGAEAPPFEAEGLREGVVRLDDFRGRYLLLHFWAPWGDPCLADLAEWEAVAEAYRGDDRLAMAWLGLSRGKGAAADMLAGRAEETPVIVQGFLGPWADDPTGKAYGIITVPTTFLIGPDGKVLESGVRGEDLLETLREHLPGR